MFEYDLMANLAVETLDKYDFGKDLEYCRQNRRMDAWDIWNYLENQHGPEVEDAFSNLSLSEFMKYLTDRYNVRWREIREYHMF